MAGGRPKWIPTEQELDLIEQLSAKRMPQQQIADHLGISIATLHERKKEYPEISDRIKRGRCNIDTAWFDAMVNVLNNPDHPKWVTVWCYYGNKFIRSDEEKEEKQKDRDSNETTIVVDTSAKEKLKELIERKSRELAKQDAA